MAALSGPALLRSRSFHDQRDLRWPRHSRHDRWRAGSGQARRLTAALTRAGIGSADSRAALRLPANGVLPVRTCSLSNSADLRSDVLILFGWLAGFAIALLLGGPSSMPPCSAHVRSALLATRDAMMQRRLQPAQRKRARHARLLQSRPRMLVCCGALPVRFVGVLPLSTRPFAAALAPQLSRAPHIVTRAAFAAHR